MKTKCKVLSFFGFFFAAAGLALGAIHLLNTLIFSLSGKRNSLNSVWKSEYGDIAFNETGEGPPLLLVHGIGIGSGSSDWGADIEELSKTYTVYAIDLPGFGNSEKRKMSYNSYYYTTVINDFISKIIGRKADVAALHASSGFVLAGAALKPRLYNSVTVINPYSKGMGYNCAGSGFLKRVLPLPFIGTLVYNYISSKRNILAHIDRNAPEDGKYADTTESLEAQYKNAHRFGTNNKYAVIAILNGFLDTPLFNLMERCPARLNVAVSADSPFPMLAEREGLSVTKIKDACFSHSICGEEFIQLL